MDIVLEQLMGYVDEIASLVSDAAPLVWEMLLLQVKVEAVGSIILAVIGLILIIGACFTFAPIISSL